MNVKTSHYQQRRKVAAQASIGEVVVSTRAGVADPETYITIRSHQIGKVYEHSTTASFTLTELENLMLHLEESLTLMRGV